MDVLYYLFIEGQLSCFQLGVIMDLTAINIQVQLFCMNMNFHFSGINALKYNF